MPYPFDSLWYFTKSILRIFLGKLIKPPYMTISDTEDLKRAIKATFGE